MTADRPAAPAKKADRPTAPTKLGPVATHKLAQLGAVAQALPDATREEIAVVQGELQAAPPDAVAPTLAAMRAAPEEVLERVREGKPAASFDFAVGLERAKAAVPIPAPPPVLLGDQAATDPQGAQAARELEARLQTWSNHTLVVVAALLAEYERWATARGKPTPPATAGRSTGRGRTGTRR
jgi:hypothetical protein